MQYNGKCTRTLAYAIAALGVLRIRTPHSHNYSQILNSAPEKYAAESATRRCCSHSTHPATLLMQFSREMGTLHWATTIIAQCNVIAARRNELIPVNQTLSSAGRTTCQGHYNISASSQFTRHAGVIIIH